MPGIGGGLTVHALSIFPSDLLDPCYDQPDHGSWVLVTLPCLVLTDEVWMTSRKVRFIQLSQLTKCPLNVSPFLSSTN